MPLLRGQLPAPGEGAVVLGETLTEALQLDVGSTVKIGFTPLRVAAISGFTSMLNRGTALMPLSDLQALLGRPGEVTLFQVRLARPQDRAEVEKVRRTIAALRPGLSVVTGNEVLRANRAFNAIAAASQAIALIALGVAMLSVFITLAMAVEERVREIGILAALGWTRGQIVALLLGEGLMLAAMAGLMGAILGSVGLSALTATIIPGGLAASSYLAMGLAGVAVALAIGALGASYPALRAARLSPAVALRHT
jgi:putative ABC transport system permease protein